MTNNRLGETVRLIRQARGMTQQELADSSHIERAYLSQIETGRKTPSWSMIDRLAESLDFPPESLAVLVFNRE